MFLVEWSYDGGLTMHVTPGLCLERFKDALVSLVSKQGANYIVVTGPL
jgi:hypothetical protein